MGLFVIIPSKHPILEFRLGLSQIVEQTHKFSVAARVKPDCKLFGTLRNANQMVREQLTWMSLKRHGIPNRLSRTMTKRRPWAIVLDRGFPFDLLFMALN